MRKKRFTGFDFTVYTIATILFLIVLYPLILVVSNSFSDPGLVSTGQVWLLPKGFSLKGYIAVFQDKRIMSGYVNTIFYTVAGTMLSLFITLPAGYALTKQNMPGRSFIMKLFLLTMYVSGGLIPTFLVMNSLGLYNTRLMMILSGGFSVYNCIICRSFFAGLPKELEEAAEIDGCSPLGIFTRIVLPLSKALLGVMVLYYAVGRWNGYFTAMIYLVDEDKKPLALVLRRILRNAQELSNDDELGAQAAQLEALIRYSSIVVSSLPLMVTYPFLQKYFDKGVLIGSVKG